MKVFYEEGLAYHFGLQRRCDRGNNVVLSVRLGGKRRPAIELRNQFKFRVSTASCRREDNTRCADILGQEQRDTAESETLCMCGHSSRENREIPSVRQATAAFGLRPGGQRTSQRARLT